MVALYDVNFLSNSGLLKNSHSLIVYIIGYYDEQHAEKYPKPFVSKPFHLIPFTLKFKRGEIYSKYSSEVGYQERGLKQLEPYKSSLLLLLKKRC